MQGFDIFKATEKLVTKQGLKFKFLVSVYCSFIHSFIHSGKDT